MNYRVLLENVVEQKFPIHPFTIGITAQNAEMLLRNYLAMSQAFPYLQAGSQAALIDDVMERNDDVSAEVEMTTVVGNFLAWDETGGHYVITRFGVQGLPSILHTDRNFHSNHLKRDIERLLGKSVRPHYSAVTKSYLRALLDGLSSRNHICRLAHMVAFEHHAGRMIDALWESISSQFSANKDELSYFRIHVGGDDPAEPYHIEMTSALIDFFLKSDTDVEVFLEYFGKAYSKNFEWCEDIKKLS